MTTTLASMTLDVARILTDVVESTATSDGAAGGTTIVDSGIPRYDLNENHFKGGTTWVLSGTRIGTSKKVSAFSSGTGTYTVSAYAGRISSGVSYAASLSYYPQDVLRRAVNIALQNISPIMALDTDTTVADQESYSLGSGVRNVKLIEIASSLVAPYNFVVNSTWEEKNDKIYFDPGTQPMSDGYTINLWYSTYPGSELTTDVGAISSYYPIEWLKWEAAVVALTWRDNLLQGEDPHVMRQLETARMEAARCRSKYLASLPAVPWEVHLAPYLHSGEGLEKYRYNGSTVRLRP